MQVKNAAMRLCAIEPSSGILTGHAAALADKVALYPYTRNHFSSFSLNSGTLVVEEDDIFAGLVPSEMIICLTSAAGYSGDLKKNPLCYPHCGCSYMAFTVGEY